MALDTIPKQEGGKLKAVASGTLPSGQPVVVNADGTVSVVAEIAISQAVGSPTVFESANSNDTSAIFDPNANKVVIAYRDRGNSDYGTAIVGTVSDMSISFGSPVVFETATSITISATFDSNANKVVIAYEDIDNSNGKAIVGTVSGTSISFGTAAVFASNVNTISAAYDSNAQKVVIAYRNLNNSNYGTAVVGTVSGTSISFGSSTVFNSALTQDISAVYDSNAQKVVIAYRDDGNSDYGTAVVGTVSGTSISFGSTTVFNSASPTYISATFDSNAQKVVIAYRDQGSYGLGTAIVGTVSGTSISFGTKVVFNNSSGISNYISATFDSNANKVVIAYRDDGNSEYGTVVAGTVSGTSISFGSPTVFESANSISMSTTFDSNANKVVISYIDLGSSGHGTASVFRNAGSESNLTSENYIGMSGGVAIPSALDTTEFQDSNTTQYVSSVYDVNAERVVIAYVNNDTSNGTGGCIVGTISGSSISFGSFTTFSTGTQISDISLTYDSTNNKCVVSYQFPSSTGQSKVATVDPSDNSITFGSAAQFSSESEQITSIFDDSSGKIVLAFRSKEVATEFDILARVGTVSGTSISWGTAATVSSVNSQWVSLGNDIDSNKIVFAYLASSQGKSKVGTVSGTSISFGSEATFTTNATYISSMAYHDALNKMILTYRDSGNSNYPTSVVGTVSGTSISFGTPVVLNSAYGGTSKRASAYDPVNQKVFTVYGPTGGSVIQDLTASGTTLVKGTTTALGHEAAFQCLTYISSLEKMLITYRGTDNDGYATLFVPEERGSVADGDAATVDIVGTVSTNQGGLTAGQQYYVQTDGTIGETPADPSVLAGTATSATKLVVKT